MVPSLPGFIIYFPIYLETGWIILGLSLYAVSLLPHSTVLVPLMLLLKQHSLKKDILGYASSHPEMTVVLLRLLSLSQLCSICCWQIALFSAVPWGKNCFTDWSNQIRIPLKWQLLRSVRFILTLGSLLPAISLLGFLLLWHKPAHLQFSLCPMIPLVSSHLPFTLTSIVFESSLRLELIHIQLYEVNSCGKRLGAICFRAFSGKISQPQL